MTLWAIIELAKSVWLSREAFLAGFAISPNLLQGFYLLLAMLGGALFAALNYEWIGRLWNRKQQNLEDERRTRRVKGRGSRIVSRRRFVR